MFISALFKYFYVAIDWIIWRHLRFTQFAIFNSQCLYKGALFNNLPVRIINLCLLLAWKEAVRVVFIDLLFFLRLNCFRSDKFIFQANIWVDWKVSRFLFQLHALGVRKEKSDRAVEVSPGLDNLDYVYFWVKLLSCHLKSTLLSIIATTEANFRDERQTPVTQVRLRAELDVFRLRKEVHVISYVLSRSLDLEQARDHEIIKRLIVPNPID